MATLTQRSGLKVESIDVVGAEDVLAGTRFHASPDMTISLS